MPIRKDDYFCGIFIEKSCQKLANLSQDIAVVRQVVSALALLESINNDCPSSEVKRLLRTLCIMFLCRRKSLRFNPPRPGCPFRKKRWRLA